MIDDKTVERRRKVQNARKIPSLIAMVSVVGFFGVMFLMFFKLIPEQSKDTLNIMVGFLGGVLTSITSFYFGSSENK